MWLRNLSRDGNSRGGALSLGAVVAVAAALAMAGCSADYVENNEGPVLLLITAINNGAQLDSDVRNGEFSTFVCENEVDVELTVQNKNPNAPTSPSSTVQLESYEVKLLPQRRPRRRGRGRAVPDHGELATTVGRSATTSPSRSRSSGGRRSSSRRSTTSARPRFSRCPRR